MFWIASISFLIYFFILQRSYIKVYWKQGIRLRNVAVEEAGLIRSLPVIYHHETATRQISVQLCRPRTGPAKTDFLQTMFMRFTASEFRSGFRKKNSPLQRLFVCTVWVVKKFSTEQKLRDLIRDERFDADFKFQWDMMCSLISLLYLLVCFFKAVSNKPKRTSEYLPSLGTVFSSCSYVFNLLVVRVPRSISGCICRFLQDKLCLKFHKTV